MKMVVAGLLITALLVIVLVNILDIVLIQGLRSALGLP